MACTPRAAPVAAEREKPPEEHPQQSSRIVLALHPPPSSHTPPHRANQTASRPHQSTESLPSASPAARKETHCSHSRATAPPPSPACTYPARFVSAPYPACVHPPQPVCRSPSGAAPEFARTKQESPAHSPAAYPAPSSSTPPQEAQPKHTTPPCQLACPSASRSLVRPP